MGLYDSLYILTFTYNIISHVYVSVRGNKGLEYKSWLNMNLFFRFVLHFAYGNTNWPRQLNGITDQSCLLYKSIDRKHAGWKTHMGKLWQWLG